MLAAIEKAAIKYEDLIEKGLVSLSEEYIYDLHIAMQRVDKAWQEMVGDAAIRLYFYRILNYNSLYWITSSIGWGLDDDLSDIEKFHELALSRRLLVYFIGMYIVRVAGNYDCSKKG